MIRHGHFLKLAMVLAAILVAPYFANAQTCASGADAGKLQYTTERYQVCDGTTWKEVDNGPTASTCTAVDNGKLEYSGGIIRYCNGRNWRTTQGVSLGSCVGITAGTYNYSAGDFRFCNGTTWYKMLQNPPAIGGYFVRARDTSNGNFGGLSGADAYCLNQLTTYNWVAKATAQANGQLVGAKVKAFLCDNTTCNNLVANTTYAFARAGSTTAGGFWFTTDASGRGPQDNSAWQAFNYFDSGSAFHSGHRDSVSATLWDTTTTGSINNYTCSNWSSSSNAVTGVVSSAAKTNTERWDRTGNLITCDTLNDIICIVNP